VAELRSSCAGLTRASIHLQKKMDCRVKPGHDKLNAAAWPVISTSRW
jgi:hypothetical protein